MARQGMHGTTTAKGSARRFLIGVSAVAIAATLAACGGTGATPVATHTAATATAIAATAPAQPATIAPTQPARGTTAPASAKALLSKEEIEAIIGRPVGEPKETEIPHGSLCRYSPLVVQVLRGTDALYGVSGFQRTYDLTEPVPEFGPKAFASRSDIVALKGEALVYIGSGGLHTDGVTEEMLKALMRAALARV